MHYPASPDDCAMTARKMRRYLSQRGNPALELDKAKRGSQAECEDHDHRKDRRADKLPCERDRGTQWPEYNPQSGQGDERGIVFRRRGQTRSNSPQDQITPLVGLPKSQREEKAHVNNMWPICR